MSLPPGYAMRDAHPDDLAVIGDLRRSVGWVAHEWALRVALAAPARSVLVTAEGGEVAAVGSGIAYGPLGWVGNMVVGSDHRRRGLGTAVLADVVAWLEAAGCTRLELYATSDGRPLYARHGFDLVEPSLMVRIPRTLADSLPRDRGCVIEAVQDRHASLDEIAAFDAGRFGGNRRVVLAALPIAVDAPLLVARRAGAVVGYAWIRPEHERLGPFLADEPAVAAALVASAFDAVPSTQVLAFNMPGANRLGRSWVENLGVELEPWEGRMARGGPIERRDDTIYGNAVGALG